MARPTIYNLSSQQLAEMSSKQLRAFIDKASKNVEKARLTSNKALRSSYLYIAHSLGTRRITNKATGKKETKLKLNNKNMSREQLLQQARLLQGHLKIDVYTKGAKQYREQVTQQALDSFRTNTKIALSKEEFAEFKFIASGIKDIIEKFGSDNVAKLYEEMGKTSKKVDRATIGSVLREVYNAHPTGTSQRDLLESTYMYLEMMYGIKL